MISTILVMSARIYGEALSCWLNSVPELAVLAHVSQQEDVAGLHCLDRAPDIAILGGLWCTSLPMVRSLRKRYPSLRILALIPPERCTPSLTVERCHIDGFCSESDSLDKVVEAVRRVFEAPVSPVVHKRSGRPPRAVNDLSFDELCVLGLIALGITQEKIAEYLDIELSTVKSRLHRLFPRIGVSTAAHAVKYAMSIDQLNVRSDNGVNTVDLRCRQGTSMWVYDEQGQVSCQLLVEETGSRHTI